MDPIREQLVMSLADLYGTASLDALRADHDRPSSLSCPPRFSPMPNWKRSPGHPIPSFFSFWIAAIWPAARGPEGLRTALDHLADEAVEAVEGGASLDHPLRS